MRFRPYAKKICLARRGITLRNPPGPAPAGAPKGMTRQGRPVETSRPCVMALSAGGRGRHVRQGSAAFRRGGSPGSRRAGPDRPDDPARGIDREFLRHNRGGRRVRVVHRSGSARRHIDRRGRDAGRRGRRRGSSGRRHGPVRPRPRSRRRGPVRRAGRRIDGNGLAQGPARAVRGHHSRRHRSGRMRIIGVPESAGRRRGRPGQDAPGGSRLGRNSLGRRVGPRL